MTTQYHNANTHPAFSPTAHPAPSNDHDLLQNLPNSESTHPNSTGTSHRPQRLRQQQPPLDNPTANPDTSWGDDPTDKDPDHVRFFFQNVNGLPYSFPHSAIIDKLSSLYDLQVDFVGLAETNLEFHHSDIRYQTKNAFKRIYDRSACTIAATSSILFQRPNKPGGTLCATTGRWCSRVMDSNTDSRDMGRWCYFTLRAKIGRTIIIMSAYHVCQNARTHLPGATTSFMQQRTIFRENGITTPNPKTPTWDRDFKAQLQLWTDLNYELIIMLDANEVLCDESKTFLWQTFRESGLVDVFHQHHPDLPPQLNDDPIVTYQRG